MDESCRRLEAPGATGNLVFKDENAISHTGVRAIDVYEKSHRNKGLEPRESLSTLKFWAAKSKVEVSEFFGFPTDFLNCQSSREPGGSGVGGDVDFSIMCFCKSRTLEDLQIA